MSLKLLIPLALITGAAPVSAQTKVAVPALVLDHVGIQAADLDRSTAFYVGVLGLTEVSAPFPRTLVRWIEVGGGRMLHIVGNGATAVERNRWDHIALACVDLDALVAHLNEGASPGPTWEESTRSKSGQIGSGRFSFVTPMAIPLKSTMQAVRLKQVRTFRGEEAPPRPHLAAMRILAVSSLSDW